MTDFMTNVKTINSAVRTVVLLGIAGVVGFGGWYGYDGYIKPGFEAKQAKADLETMKAEFSKQAEQLKETERLNERLETSLKLLKVDRRIANVKVLEKRTDEEGQAILEVRFSEMDQFGNIVGSPRDYTLKGEKFYVDGWVVTFEDKYIENADELRSASMFVFRSIYGDGEKPKDGQRLDLETMDKAPPGIYKSPRQNEFEQQIWSDFWKVCNDRDLQKKLGIRASQGEAPYVFAEEGKTYQVNIRSSGGMSLQLVDE